MKKRVLILTSVASMIEQFNIPIIKLLIEMGYEVHVACNFKEGNTIPDKQVEELKKELQVLRVEYYQIDFRRNFIKMFNHFQAYREVKDLIKTNEYTFIHCHSPIGGVVGRLAGRSTKTKVAYTAHGFHFYTGAPLVNWLIYYPIERWLARYTDVLITINKEDYNRAVNFKAKKIEYIPGVGVNIRKFKLESFNQEEKRKSIGVNKNDFIIMSVGELNKNKNHEVIIRAIARLKEENIKYIICGKGPLRTDLIDLIHNLKIENQVKILGFRKDVRELYTIVDMFAFPSFREGLSLALMEAMASGLPVVCSNIRGNTDLIKHGKGGYLADPNQAIDFSKKIKSIYDSEKLRNEYAQFNKKIINDFSIDNVKKNMKNIYREI